MNETQKSAKVLVIAEHDQTTLRAATARTITCAAQLGTVDVVVFRSESSAVCTQAAEIAGVKQVIDIQHATNNTFLASTLAPQIAELAADYDAILMPSTTFGKDVLPRVAALLSCPQVSDLMAVLGARKFQRPIYAGNVLITVDVPDDCKILATVRTASFEAAGAADTPAPTIEKSLEVALPDHTEFVELKQGGGDQARPGLQSATRVVSGGRALGSAENFDLIYKLADMLEAGVGASRAAVDAGYVPNDMQVGQTGKIIAPDLYIAVGISGAIQRITGIKDAGTIVAINKDGDAPIFEIADIGLVADLFDAVPELTQALAKR